MNTTRTLLTALAATACCAAPLMAAEAFPSRPIRFIVPYAPGGGPDVTTRLVAQRLEPRIKQSIIVEAKPGGNGIVGMTEVARSKPDGYTAVYGTGTILSAAKAMLKNPPYDAIRDFSAITIFQEVSFGLLVGPSEKGTSFAQLIEKMRRNPEKYPVGAAFSTAEIFNNLLTDAAGLKHSYVSYKLAPQTLNDLMAGTLGAAISSINAAQPLIDAGKLHIVAVTAPQRLAILPNTPAAVEYFPGVTVGNWNGYFVPAKTPRPVINFLNRHMLDVLRAPDLMERNGNTGRALLLTPEEADARVKKEETEFIALFKKAGIKPQ